MGLTWAIFRGQAGAVRTGRVSDADGYVDLSDYDSVHFVASRSLTSEPVIDVAVTVDPDQVANKGKFSYTFDGTTAAIPSRTYGYCSLKCMSGANPTYFPLDKRTERTYFKLVVQEPVA